MSPQSIRPPRRLILAQFTLGLGGLFIGTGEFAAMGLLPAMANSAKVSVTSAGGLISAYALGVVLASPLLATLTARVERRRLLILLALMVLIGNGASAIAKDFGQLVVTRFLAGLPHGAYYGTASIVSATMVPASQRAQAIGRVMLGLAAANMIGVPVATWLGQALGWQVIFMAVAAGGALLMPMLCLFVPVIPANRDASPMQELSAFTSLRVWLTLGVATIGFGGMFAVYSYITPTLTLAAHVPDGDVPWFLALWGLGMVLGNVIGGWLADRALIPAIFGILLWNVVTLGAFDVAASGPASAAMALFFIGIGFALVPALQARLMDVAPKAPSLAAAMNHSAFNLSNAIGAWSGGLVIAAGYGWQSTGLIGAALAMAGLAIMGLSARIQRHGWPKAASAS